MKISLLVFKNEKEGFRVVLELVQVPSLLTFPVVRSKSAGGSKTAA